MASERCTCPSTTTLRSEHFGSPPSGRKNFLFIGTDHAGESLAGLYSLLATCEANDVNPVAYLADVLVRVQNQPKSRIDELIPHKWKPTVPQ